MEPEKRTIRYGRKRKIKVRKQKNGTFKPLNANVFYDYYTYEKRRKYPILPQTTCHEVIRFIHRRVWFYMVTELWSFKPPGNFGEFRIRENQSTSGFYTNWKKTMVTGRKEKEYNIHSNGRRFFIHWDKSLCKLKHKKLYTFSPEQGESDIPYVGKRGLGNYIKGLAADPTKPDYRAHLI